MIFGKSHDLLMSSIKITIKGNLIMGNTFLKRKFPKKAIFRFQSKEYFIKKIPFLEIT